MANKMPAIVLEGDQELMDLLDSIPSRMMTAAGHALRAVAKPIVADARRRLFKGHGLLTGQLKKSLGVRKVLTYRQQQRVVVYIGPREGFKVRIRVPRVVKDSFGRPTGIDYAWRNHDPHKIAHLVEFGHRVANIGAANKLLPASMRAARVAERVEPRPFLRPAIDSNRFAFLERMKTAIRKTLEKKAKPARRRAA